MAQSPPDRVKLTPEWGDLTGWLENPARSELELRDLCRRLNLAATGSMTTLRGRLRTHIGIKAERAAPVPSNAVPESWTPAMASQTLIEKPMKATSLPAIAVDREVLKVVTPAYALPLAGLGLAALGVGAAAPIWPFLFAPAIALHALIVANVASRRAAPDEDAGFETAPDVAQLQKDLLAGLTSIKSTEGLKALQDLVYEYAQLQPIMARRRVTDSIAVGQVPALADETYKQGMSVLQDALDLMQASSPEDRQRLEAENADLQKEIAALGAHDTQTARVKIRQERLASNKELLDLIDKQQARIDELLYQCDRCGASLHRTRMELAALRADSSEDGVSAVVDTLRLTISHAKSVQDEMKRLTSPDPGPDRFATPEKTSDAPPGAKPNDNPPE
jgi:hypothetical protein